MRGRTNVLSDLLDAMVRSIKYKEFEGPEQGLTVSAGAVRCFLEAALHATATELLR